MNIELRPIQSHERETLRNIWEKYDYEFSQFDHRDVDEFGLYGDKDLAYYWSKETKWLYFILVDAKIAGFAAVTNLPIVEDTKTDFQIGEFFVLFKYRRLGVGKAAFFQLLALHPGQHQLVRHPQNTLSVHFWNHVVAAYTKGHYTLVQAHPGFLYADGTPGDVFFFKT